MLRQPLTPTANSLLFFIMLCASSWTACQEYVRTDRYTLVELEIKSEQREPLTSTTYISLGRDVTSVGDAIHELLVGTGYRWQGNEDQILNELPLPNVVRNIGPLRLEDALRTLAGSAWTLKTNSLTRIVWFEVDEQMAMRQKPKSNRENYSVDINQKAQ